jgi:RHS repeat-associated protein
MLPIWYIASLPGYLLDQAERAIEDAIESIHVASPEIKIDGALQGVTYTNAEHPTPSVSYTYDSARGRLATMTDGIGTTAYSYYPYGTGQPGSLGAGQVQSVSGPFTNETVAYQYDQLGRVTTRTTDGVDETYAFDNLGRLQTDTNALGAFSYGYDGTTSRVTSVNYPNGQQALYSYFEDNTQDRRLSQIKHLTPSSATLDQFDYAYDGPLGRISHWGQQQPGATISSPITNAYDLGYDAIGQLKSAKLNGDSSNTGSGVWSYDAASNRTGQQSGSSTVSTAVPTATNSIFSLSGGGKLRVAGSLSEWAQVSVNGQTATLDSSNNTFKALVPLALGAQTLSISATDASGNTATNHYQLTISSAGDTNFSSDANGNTSGLTPTAAGTTPQSLEFDALDRVTAIVQGNHRTEFGYDGAGARVRITEKDNGSVTTDRLYVDGEERDATTGQMLRRFYGQGEQRFSGTSASNYFYAGDHLGSTREMTDSSGALHASYTYDTWGQRTKQSGDLDTEIGFTGYWHHAQSGFEISPTRLYASGLGRYLSEDPLQEASGQLNLFAYCANDPVNLSDPLGLSWTGAIIGIVVGTSVGVGFGLLAPEFAAGLLGAMVIGGLASLASDLAVQLYENGGNFSCINVSQAFSATVVGALFGGAGFVAARALSGTFGGLAGDARAFNTIARVEELKAAIPAAQQGRITMAVGLAEDSDGVRQVLIGTSEPMGYLRPGVSLNPGEVLAPGLGHSEEDIVNYALQNNLNLLEVGATRPICLNCASLIQKAGATPITPLKFK